MALLFTTPLSCRYTEEHRPSTGEDEDRALVAYWFLWWPVREGWVFALVCALSGSKVEKDCMEDDEEEQIGRFYLYSSGKQIIG